MNRAEREERIKTIKGFMRGRTLEHLVPERMYFIMKDKDGVCLVYGAPDEPETQGTTFKESELAQFQKSKINARFIILSPATEDRVRVYE